MQPERPHLPGERTTISRPQIPDELLDEIRQESQIDNQPPQKNKSSKLKWLVVTLLLLLVAVAAAAGAGYVWYTDQLASPSPGSQETARVVVDDGDTSSIIAEKLAKKNVIKNQFAFELYYRLNQTSGLKSGIYVVERSSSVQDIVTHLENGKSDEFTLTFLPGGTLFDAKKVLLDAGYDDASIEAAFKKNYTHPLLKGKPAGADIEGYVYGDTYNFLAGSSVEDVLVRIFDHMYDVVVEKDLEAAYAAQDMTLYEGLIFSSIVQGEVSAKSDMARVSQVLHKRLDTDIPLGADITFIYGARKLGVAPSVDLDSPYNTRNLTGLPPTPISNPGVDALVAGANPADTDDLFFVAGDDGVTYFSKTYEEHQRLTAQHCQQNCILPER